MKTKSAIVLWLALFFALVPLAAQGGNGSASVYIPFDFNVGDRHLPAGEYTVTSVNQSVVELQLENRRRCALAITTAIGGGIDVQNRKLVFNRYGEHYFLTQVWLRTSNQGRGLSVSPAEEELDEFVRTAPEERTIMLAMK